MQACGETARSSTTVIANMIRRSARQNELMAEIRSRFERLRLDGHSGRQIYLIGMADGQQMAVRNLADLLFAVQSAGLGRAAAIEESNSHVLFRIQECTCCRVCGQGPCHFVAGFLAGCLMATGRFSHLEVKEVSCGEYPGDTCLFRADLVPKS